MQNEPVAIWPTLGALIGAILVRFIPDLGDDLINAIVAAVVIVGPVIAGAIFARSKVTPLANPKTAEGEPAQLVAK